MQYTHVDSLFVYLDPGTSLLGFLWVFLGPKDGGKEGGSDGWREGGDVISGAVWLLLPCWCWCIADSCSVNLRWVPPGPHLLWGLRKCNFAPVSPRTLKTSRVCCPNFPLQEGGIFSRPWPNTPFYTNVLSICINVQTMPLRTDRL